MFGCRLDRPSVVLLKVAADQEGSAPPWRGHQGLSWDRGSCVQAAEGLFAQLMAPGLCPPGVIYGYAGQENPSLGIREEESGKQMLGSWTTLKCPMMPLDWGLGILETPDQAL